jgi:hypothetical protein
MLIPFFHIRETQYQPFDEQGVAPQFSTSHMPLRPPEEHQVDETELGFLAVQAGMVQSAPRSPGISPPPNTYEADLGSTVGAAVNEHTNGRKHLRDYVVSFYCPEGDRHET